MKAIEIELELANRYFNKRQDLIVPNVSYGFQGFNESDLLICTKAGYLIEVEIKISKADLKRDIYKNHNHNVNHVKEFYFAIPIELKESIDYIPGYAGIIIVYPKDHGTFWDGTFHRTKPSLLRAAKVNKLAKSITIEDRYKLARLGALRIWKLKKKILERAK